MTFLERLNFLKIHEISIRSPEPTSIGRAVGLLSFL